jgi:hypothetical protein
LTKAERDRASSLKRRYGITPEQYQKMLDRQGGICAICGRPPKTLRLSVDHDHRTGRVRGLLCYQCNKYFVGKNNLETARQVARYLEQSFDGRKL